MTGGRGRTPAPPISALPLRQPRPPLRCDAFRGELAIPGLDRSFAPTPRSGERIARQYPCGPPPGLRPASPCPGVGRPASSLIAVAPPPIRRPRLPPHEGAVPASRFPCAFGHDGLRLATAMNSLARDSRRKVGPRPHHPPSHLPGGGGQGVWGLSGPTLLSPRGFRLFSPPFRGSFQLSLAVLVRYRSRDVFSLGGR